MNDQLAELMGGEDGFDVWFIVGEDDDERTLYCVPPVAPDGWAWVN